MFRFWFKILLFAFSLSLVFTRATDADLIDKKTVSKNSMKAATLDFSQVNTVNNQRVDTLFNVEGLVPGGFQSSTLRIKNSGDTNFKYHLSTSKTGGSDSYCQALNLQILQKAQLKYDGPLLDLKLDTLAINQNGIDDWIFLIGLGNQVDSSLQNQSCEFELVFDTLNNSNTYGFKLSRRLSNKISSFGFTN